jgi:formiminotetrahydrofolate cyclodeaminase
MTTWNEDDVAACLKVMDPEDDQTGGGTAAAVAGAMAAGLAGMVARLSVGREGMEPDPYYREIPKCTDDEKAARSRAIQDGMVGAAMVPLENAERCANVLALVGRLEGRSNRNAASDLEVAGALARTALEGCLANVAINVESIKDEQTADSLTTRAGELRSALQIDEAAHG